MVQKIINYDLNNLKLISEEEIQTLNSTEVQQFCDQLDQGTIIILQQIDENFAKANQILTERILPSIQRHGENSQQIWESIKFWRSFFEAAANTKLNEPMEEEELSYTETEQGNNPSTNPLGGIGSGGGIGEESISFSQDSDASTSLNSTPRPLNQQQQHQFSNDLSPFQSLKQDLNQMGLKINQKDHLLAMNQTVKDVHRLRLGDLPPDSPDFPSEPLELEVGNRSNIGGGGGGGGKGKERAYEGSPKARSKTTTASNTTTNTTTTTGQSSDLLHNLLRKNLSSKPTTTTTTNSNGKLLVPSEIPNNWNGIADLSNTPLTGLVSPIKRRTNTTTTNLKNNNNNNNSPLPSMSFSLSPNPYSKTPKKETVKRIIKDVYNFTTLAGMPDSPLEEPPSVMKNWVSRGYDTLSYGGTTSTSNAAASIVPPGSSEGMRKGFEEENNYDDDEDEEESIELPKSRLTNALMESSKKLISTTTSTSTTTNSSSSLANFGGGTTTRIDDLLLLEQEEGEGFENHHLQVEEELRHLEDHNEGNYSLEEDESYTLDNRSRQQEEEEEELSIELPHQRNGGREREGPEDTLFGMPQRTLANGGILSSNLIEESFIGNGGEEGGQFKVLGRSEMDTLYGGNLLESEPFEASPLANRRR